MTTAAASSADSEIEQLRALPLVRSLGSRYQRRALIAALVIAGLLGALYINRQRVNTVFGGPEVLDAAQLDQRLRSGDAEGNLVDVRFDSTVDTGITLVKGTSESVQARFELGSIGDRLILIKTKDQTIAKRFRGVLRTPPYDLRNTDTLREGFVNGQITALFLDATSDFRFEGAIALLVGLVVAAIASLIIVRFAAMKRDPRKIPEVSAHAQYPDGVVALMTKANSELSQPHPTIGAFHATPNFVIEPRRGVIAAQDVMWAHGKTTKTRIYGVIPAGSRSELIIHSRAGKPLSHRVDAAAMQGDLEKLRTAFPHVVLGYSDDLNQIWTKQRASFVQQVDARRAELANESATTQ